MASRCNALTGRQGPETMKRISGLITVLIPNIVVVSLGEATLVKTSMPKKPNLYTGKLNVIQGGNRLFNQAGCSGCHGGTGRGGVGLPLIDEQWKYGADDETQFKLITEQIGESRMPSFGEVLEDDEIWKILGYVRSLYQGEPSKIVW